MGPARPAAQDEGVDVWRADLDTPAPLPGGVLSAAEGERRERLRTDTLRRRWGVSRWALREVLSRYLGAAPGAIELTEAENGKPVLAGARGLQFNLSHSGAVALVAVCAGRPVGVDVEHIDPDRDLLKLAERVLPGADVAAVASAVAEQRAAAFYAAWTRHEARLKCHGGGFGGEPAQEPVAAVNVEVGPGYAGAVAIPGGEPPVPRSFLLALP